MRLSTKTLTAAAAVLGVALMLLGSPPGASWTPDGIGRAQAFSGGGLVPAAPGAAAARPAHYDGPAAEVANDALNRVLQTYCWSCHNDALMTGNMSLMRFDVSDPGADPVLGEKMVNKLRAAMMPPPGQPRPRPDTLLALVETLERNLDRAVQRDRNPGMRPSQRLNRPEYQAAIKSLLGLEVDAGNWLPQDAMDANFDNIAHAQLLSPLAVEAYLNAAVDISRLALGDRNAESSTRTYVNLDYISQHPWDHVEGAPYGTRGGMVVNHVFPADGYYVFDVGFSMAGNTRLEDIDISINDEQAALLHYERNVGVTVTSQDGRARAFDGGLQTQPIFVRAGQHKVSVAFVRKAEGPYETLMRPHEWALAGIDQGTGATTLWPHIGAFFIRGPQRVTGLSDTPARQKIFSCRPTSPSEEAPCAREIINRLGSEAWRRPLSAQEVAGIEAFYQRGRDRGDFETGVRMALEAILAHPNFYFRLETQPTNVREGRNFDLSDTDLATRLAFFLWGTPPDEELRELAERGRLSDRRTLEQQTTRMLRDPRAEALGTRFAAQWLRLQDLYKVRADPNFFPNFDENLQDAMRRETELFFYNLVREDRSILDLYTADYTFVNERLARHYGFENVAGSYFRKVDYPDDTRLGIFGQGSVLALTSLAGRTSPVMRGKWVMEVLLGTPPPPPPPGVPQLSETEGTLEGRILTTRQRMEVHRDNPACRECHQFIDPVGLALDNFDITGKWRFRENGMPLDTRGMLYDGTEISSPRELADALLKRPIPLVRTFTENLMTYALGRRLEYFDQPTVRAIAKEAEDNDYRISSFILGVVKSDQFQMRRADVVTDNTRQ